MKKIIALLLGLLLACTALCALADTADVVGEWYLTEMEQEGERVSTAGLIEMTLFLAEDGSAATIMKTNSPFGC